jgi:hypothetical protein
MAASSQLRQSDFSLPNLRLALDRRKARGNSRVFSAAHNRRLARPRHHLRNNRANCARFVLSGSSFERIRPLECIRSCNLHLPPVVRLRPNDRNTPVARPVGKYVLDHCNHIPLQLRIAGVMHLHCHCHTRTVYAGPPSSHAESLLRVERLTAACTILMS